MELFKNVGLPKLAVPMEGHHRLFGLTVRGDFPWLSSLPGCAGPAELVLSRLEVQNLASVPSYIDSFCGQSGESLCLLYRERSGEVLQFPGAGDFRISHSKIEGYFQNQENALAELRFLGPVLSYWFELRGCPTLHAAAVARNGRAIAFVSRHGGGKSGLAASMIQAGASLLTDDLLALDEREDLWEARPSYPEMRMWPDEVSHFVGSPEDLPHVHAESEKRRVAIGNRGFGSFLDASTPLACVYLASRSQERCGGVELRPVSRSEALIELLRHSFSARLVEGAGLQPARLDRLARLVRSVPVYRLVYPSGFEQLPEIAEILMSSW